MASAGVALYSESCCVSNSMITEEASLASHHPATSCSHPWLLPTRVAVRGYESTRMDGSIPLVSQPDDRAAAGGLGDFLVDALTSARLVERARGRVCFEDHQVQAFAGSPSHHRRRRKTVSRVPIPRRVVARGYVAVVQQGTPHRMVVEDCVNEADNLALPFRDNRRDVDPAWSTGRSTRPAGHRRRARQENASR
jgi:hypothetical protein